MDLNINAFIRTRFWACPTVLGRAATGIASPHVVSTPERLVAVNWVVTRWSWERLLQYWWDVGTLHVTARLRGWTLQIHILEACTFQIFPFHKSGHTCRPCVVQMTMTILLFLYAEILLLNIPTTRWNTSLSYSFLLKCCSATAAPHTDRHACQFRTAEWASKDCPYLQLVLLWVAFASLQQSLGQAWKKQWSLYGLEDHQQVLVMQQSHLHFLHKEVQDRLILTIPLWKCSQF